MLRIKAILVAISVMVFSGCKTGNGNSTEELESDIVQNTDGNIFLNLKDAYLLFDESHPENNTAEWTFTVMNSGRFEVWLSSLTKDTMDLNYGEPVIIHFGDKRLESQPIGNEIILNDNHVSRPYFRADSHLGSILIEDSGNYNLQVVSDKVLPAESKDKVSKANTILDQIILKPQTR